MAFDGTGNFNLIYDWPNDKANGIPITASRMQGQEQDMAANGFGLCLTRDGQGFATANLPMGGFKHTGAAVATAAGQYVVYQQWLLTKFAAYMSASTTNATGDGTAYTVPVDTADFNVNSAFSTGTGLFTAPVAGVLSARGRAQLSPVTNSFTEVFCSLNTSGGLTYIGGGDTSTIAVNTVTNQMNVSIADDILLAAGETVAFVVRAFGGSKGIGVVGGRTFSRFSGIFYPSV